jgi:hypothetical protein
MLDSSGFAQQATGFELGVFNYKGAPGAPGANPLVWGYDCVNLGPNKCESAFIARASPIGFFHGFEAQNCDTSFQCSGDGTILMSVNSANAQNFTINTGGSMELGPVNVAGAVYLDFHTSGNNIDYDSRIIALGGSASVGDGSITFLATSAIFSGVISLSTVGLGITVAEGTNAKQGVATLAAGTVTVSNTSVTANSRIFLTGQQSNGGTPGFLRVSTRVVGTSFTITSSSATDTSVVAYEIFEPS